MARGQTWLLPDTIDPAETVCFQIHIPKSQNHIAAFFGNLEALARAWNWDDAYGDGSNVAYVWRRVIDDAIACFREDSCCMPILRANPTNQCIIEQSYDCGQTWVTLVDFLTCVESATQPLFDAQADRILDELLDRFDGTAQSIDDRLAYDGSDDDIWRDYALCNALEIWVKAMAEAEINRRDANAEIWDSVADTLLAVAGISLAIPIPGARLFAAGASLVSAFIRVAGPAWDAVNILALQDTSALEAVACSMYRDMRGQTPTQSVFAAALNTPDFSQVSFAGLVAAAIQPMLSEIYVYVGFLDLWAGLLDYAQGGFIDSCDCPDIGWTVKFLDGNGVPPNATILPNPPYNIATYNNPGDYYTASDTPSQPTSSAFVILEFDTAADFDIEFVEFSVDMFNTRSGGFGEDQEFRLYDEFDVLIDQHQTAADFSAETTPKVATWEEANTGRKLRLIAKIFEPNNGETTEVRMFKISIHGTGTIPPEWIPYEV